MNDVVLRLLSIVLVDIGEPIANARFGQNDARRGGMVLDLGAQLANEYAQVLRVVPVRRPPHRRENLSMCDKTPGVTSEGRQKNILFWGQFYRNTFFRHRTLDEINAQSATLDLRRFMSLLCHMAQSCAHPRQEFSDSERLFHVVVGA
jgi:hypothetical protein